MCLKTSEKRASVARNIASYVRHLEKRLSGTEKDNAKIKRQIGDVQQ